jgi:hypothetical protein
MTMNQLRERIAARPFESFRLILKNGREYTVSARCDLEISGASARSFQVVQHGFNVVVELDQVASVIDVVDGWRG